MNELELTDTFTFLVEYLDLPTAVGEPGATWETFQLAHLNNSSLMDIELKSRQVGWSWLSAAESVASAILNPRTPHIFVSINKTEAAEKIRYAKAVLEALDPDVRPRLAVDNRFAIELHTGARLESHPCRPVRGKARAKIYLDEFAHYPNDDEIYQSVIPVLTKGGFLRIGSSPFGARGKFWEIYTESLRKYPGYTRSYTPWWKIRSLCADLPEAAKNAPCMPTEERVKRYGSSRLIILFENMPLGDFQQEYEGAWLDESISWIDWDLIQLNQDLAANDKLIYRKVNGVAAAESAIDEIKTEIIAARIEGALFGGVDIGRVKDTTEIILVGDNEMYSQLPYRLGITLERVKFDRQQDVLDAIMQNLPVANLLIDQNGIGAQLAETTESRYPDRAKAVAFTNSAKEIWAVEVKRRAQRGQTPLPIERDLAYQIHSIRKRPTPGLRNSFDTADGTKGHHADMFWAWALAVFAGSEMNNAGLEVGKSPTAGHRG